MTTIIIIDKNDYIKQHYKNAKFDYDTLIGKLNSITNKDFDKIEQKRKEASEFHFHEIFNNYSYIKKYTIKKYSSEKNVIKKLHELTNSIISNNKDICDKIINTISKAEFEEINDLLKSFDENEVRNIIKIDIDELSFKKIEEFVNYIFEKYLAFYLSKDLSKYWSQVEFEKINGLEYIQFIKVKIDVRR